jgi:pimeloyl-ACP methyl ester carboxylesterase
MPSRRAFVGGLAGLALMRSHAARALPEPVSPGIERAYLDGPFGQVHVRIARPRTVSAPPIALFHQSPLSGRMFDRLLPLLADRRIAIAVDTPGYGESDRPPTRPTLAGYGDAILTALRTRFDGPVDLMGYHTGAVIAADLAARTTDVRRLVLIAMPYFDETRRTALLAQLATPADPADDGSHLLPMWAGTFKARPPGQSIDDVARLVAEKQRPGRHGEWALIAAMGQPLTGLLSRIAAPTLVLAPHDGLQDACAAAAALIPDARLVDLPALQYGLFDAAPEAIAKPMLAFLDAG